jgi:hypothetical protein
MVRQKTFRWVTIAGTLALLLGLSLHPSGLVAQEGSCTGVWVCDSVFSPSAGRYVEVCRCCEVGETPGSTGVAITVMPPSTPTPRPTGTYYWCLPDGCAPGETRLWLVLYLSWFGSYFPMRAMEPCCGPSCPCVDPSEIREPCGPGNGWLNCSEYEASVEADLPVWHADREPYPRALVTLPVEMWVSDAAGNPTTALPSTEAWGDPVDPGGDACDCRDDGSCEDDPPPVGTVCEYRLGLRIDPGSEPPTWHIEDCGTTTGWRASCPGWTRSSWGKPELGVGMAPDCPQLPAYTVRATVPYWWSFGRQWEQWEVVGQDCECAHWPGFGTAACDLDGDGENDPDTKRVCENRYDWRHHGPDWVLLDLTLYGWPTPYMLNPNVQLAAHPPCELAPPVGALYIPCIEVQAPIEKQP